MTLNIKNIESMTSREQGVAAHGARDPAGQRPTAPLVATLPAGQLHPAFAVGNAGRVRRHGPPLQRGRSQASLNHLPVCLGKPPV